jgi:PleD family two-component response regulator
MNSASTNPSASRLETVSANSSYKKNRFPKRKDAGMTDTKSKILIIEDDLDVAEMLNAYFRVQGYEVFTVNWGEDGVRSAQTDHPDLVILGYSPTRH